MSYYNLFLDDCRRPVNVHWVDLPLVEWKIARSYEEFVKMLDHSGIPARVSFDYDLVDINHLLESKSDQPPKTGADCAAYLVAKCLESNTELPEYTIHSLSHDGSYKIKVIMTDGLKRLIAKKSK